MTPIAIALVLAHAVAVVAVSHSHYFCSPPSRQLWFWLELAIAAAVYWPARGLVRWVLAPAVAAVRPNERPVVVALPVILGGLTAAWWAGQWADNLWLHSPRVAAVLRVTLILSHAAI